VLLSNAANGLDKIILWKKLDVHRKRTDWFRRIPTLIDEALPLCRLFGIRTESIGYGEATMKMHFNPDLIRPGGTVAGPALMAIADATLYAVVLGMIGRVELAVTTSLNINFLRKPPQADIIAEGRILKLGQRLAWVR